MFGISFKTLSTALVASLGVAISTIGLDTDKAYAQFGGAGVRSGGGFSITFGPNGFDFNRYRGDRRGRPDRFADRRGGFRRGGFGSGGFGRRGPGHDGPRHGGQPIRPDFIGETGTVRAGQRGPRQWHAVQFRESYHDPVVVMGPLTRNGPQPANVRVRNIGPRGFEFKIDEWAYLDGVHRAETVGYMVVEAGHHRLPGGGFIVAGRANGVDQRWQRVRFGDQLGIRPIVLTSVMGRGRPVVARVRNVNRRGFGLRVQKEEGLPPGVPQSRRVSWVAIKPGDSGQVGLAYVAGATGVDVDENGHVVRLGRGGRLPVVLAAMQTFQGADPAGLRYAPNRRGFTVFVEEERSHDGEVSHASEQIGFAAFQAGLLEAATPPGRRYLGGGDHF
ncbi:MAG: hypothetical protein O7A03_09575, partial [Alphaproteobacteria bacterium]|nr:hypothetical protein [Alphaproteobacteria bacterium]